MEYMYVLDCTDDTINEIELNDEDKYKSSEEILIEHGMDLDGVLWIYTSNRITKINTLSKV